ncbi:hypothetical protein A3I45_02815 [Candidatus Uhrbacteria bacterium RIFCSPLOWO2_02_FULL_53_10]|uniref:Thioredoxin domain-containing protein n=1 Tax=Candidatus Uhrbacteria bacterium RIFCSPLOWO2_02_FULL_53_10 TaxID=1802411 RepID=A0A1F7VFX0_9BACT|nr:MAG: hypothetical protein A3I45_02815 [Candidatus Uhrbacteria bacterium RIFCSPLOWO2_02_FULL_53_10]
MDPTEEYLMSDKERREQKKDAQREASRRARQSKARKHWLLWGGLVIVLFVIVFGVARLANNSSAPSDGGVPLTTTDSVEGEWTKGNPEAPIVLIEYSDFQCPACRNYYPAVKDVAAAYPDDVKVVYRHYPLRSIHENAQIAGQAAEAAGMQGKFWEMHDLLFENQSEWSTGVGQKATFVRYAEELGLDVERFKDDLTSNAAQGAVNRGYVSAIQAGVNSTPTFFLNGQQIQVAPDVAAFAELIDPLVTENPVEG